MESSAGQSIPIALCADDFAFARGVDDGILALAERGRITAFSCMTASPRWRAAAARLAPLLGKLDIGLHFTLTQLAPVGPMPKLAPDGKFPTMGQLYLRAARGGVDAGEIEAELLRQIDAFAEATGRQPDFLDGHHHVHQLPGVRAAVARAWRARVPRGPVRNTASTVSHILRRNVAIPSAVTLALLGRSAQRVWLGAGLATNADFAGVRSFKERAPFRELMRGYLSAVAPGLLIMCHPGTPDDELARIDSVTAPRADELAYLSGEQFPADLAAAGCRLERFSSLAAR
jgi:predicted glycoside hydrolase/deacetylase ChbG (UPF0249 family)